jgi:hypothetical protein
MNNSQTSPKSTRHRCLNAVSGQCTRGNGKPKRKRCGYCGSAFLMETGVWGCFVWTVANNYSLASALSTHATEQAARRAAETDERLVWRFVAS